MSRRRYKSTIYSDIESDRFAYHQNLARFILAVKKHHKSIEDFEVSKTTYLTENRPYSVYSVSLSENAC